MRKTILTLFILTLSFCAVAQSNASDPKDKGEVVQTEKVSGVWDLVGYFGGKLGGELQRRLNLVGESEKDVVPTNVKIKVLGIGLERVENRPVRR